MEVYALDLDEELLNHLANPESWTVISGEDISPELIFDDTVRSVYVWQKRHLREHHKVATPSVLELQFPEIELSDPDIVIGDLIDRLRDRYAHNTQRDKFKALAEIQRDNPLELPQALIKAGQELKDLTAKKGDIYGTGDYVRAMRQYNLKVQAGPGLSYGHPDLDEYFYGMKGLNFIVAPPKTYKSWQLIQAVMVNAIEGKCAWLFSLELPAQETDFRLRCALADVPWWHYLRNCITPEEDKRLEEASQVIDESGLYKIVKPPAGKRTIDHMVYQARDAGADGIWIDQLQYVEGTNGVSLGAHNKTGEYWDVLNHARDLSDDGPIMIAHQFNRSAMFSEGMPSMEQIKGSSAVEETATLALGMWANRPMRKSGVLEIGVLCARNYQYASWEMEVELSHGCNFKIKRRMPEEDG